jgi:hypothetical protein
MRGEIVTRVDCCCRRRSVLESGREETEKIVRRLTDDARATLRAVSLLTCHKKFSLVLVYAVQYKGVSSLGS